MRGHSTDREVLRTFRNLASVEQVFSGRSSTVACSTQCTRSKCLNFIVHVGGNKRLEKGTRFVIGFDTHSHSAFFYVIFTNWFQNPMDANCNTCSGRFRENWQEVTKHGASQ